jgi:hypothetical protein
LDIWEEIVTMLEDAEDAEELKKSRVVREETIPWKEAKKDFGLGE